MSKDPKELTDFIKTAQTAAMFKTTVAEQFRCAVCSKPT